MIDKQGAFGPIQPEDPNDEYWVPPEERLDTDEGDQSDAVDDETGADMEAIARVLEEE